MAPSAEVSLGASILRRYTPDQWLNSGGMGGDNRIPARTAVLQLDELRRGAGAIVSEARAQANAAGIQAWFESHKIAEPGVSVVINDRRGWPAYVVLTTRQWNVASALLERLSKR